MTNNKTIVIGLDAATWSVIDDLLNEGRLPCLQSLMKNGVYGTLTSTIPPMTPLAWNSLVTGVNPGKHGIYDFVEQNKEDYKISPIVSRGVSLDQPAIWDLFNERDRKVGIVDFPLNYPPPEVDSFFISGLSSPENGSYAYPRKLMDKLKEKKYRIHPRFDFNERSKSDYVEEVKRITRIQLETSLELIDEYDLDLFWVVFMGIDWVQHYLWESKIDGKWAVAEIYQYMDKVIGRLLDFVGEKWSVFVLSDHGFQGVRGEAHINNLLEKWGYLKRKERTISLPEKAMNTLLKNGKKLVGRFPISLKQSLKKLSPELVNSKLHQIESKQSTMHENIEWTDTKAFSYGYMGKIYINTKSDYPKGTVKKGNYEVIRDEIINKLRELRSPDNEEKMIESVYKREEVYHGKHLSKAPDIVFEPSDFAYMFYGDFSDSWYLEPQPRVADHNKKGIFIVKGEGVKKNEKLSATVLDIAPSLLYLNNMPILKSMDGVVLKELFKNDYIKNNPVSEESLSDFETPRGSKNTNAEDSEDEVTSRLEDLGYL